MRELVVRVPLPFFLRETGDLSVASDVLDVRPNAAFLEGRSFRVSRGHQMQPAARSGEVHPQTVLAVAAAFDELTAEQEAEIVRSGLLAEVLQVVNLVIDAYRSVTRESNNSGFLGRIGWSHMCLYAEIELDGQDVRERWPFPSLSTFPLRPEQKQEVIARLADPSLITPEDVFYSEAAVALNRGEYCQSLVLSVIVTEMCVAKAVSAKLAPAEAEKFRKGTFGTMIGYAAGLPRSAGTYWGDQPGFDEFWHGLSDLNEKRIDVLHYGRRDISQDDAADALKAAGFALNALK